MGSKVISDMVTALKGLAVYLVRKRIYCIAALILR